jgi:hypothetical protein
VDWTQWTVVCGPHGRRDVRMLARLVVDITVSIDALLLILGRLALLAALEGGLDNMPNRTNVLSICIDSL